MFSRDFEHAAEIALKKIFRTSSDWRYRHLLQNMNVFQVLPYMMKARLKSTSYKDTVVEIGRCSTETGTEYIFTRSEIYFQPNMLYQKTLTLNPLLKSAPYTVL